MLFVKDGKIHAKQFAFSLPENMHFYFDSGIEPRDHLQFISSDGIIILEVMVRPVVPTATLEAIATNGNMIATSDIFSIERKGLIGKALFYRTQSWQEECYEEHYDLEPGLIAEIRVKCSVSETTRGKLRSVLEKYPISDFFETVQCSQ